MTIRSEFSGWVNEIKPTEWGAYVSMSHERRVKNEATDTWETEGRDYLDISVPANLLPVFEANKLVKVIFNQLGTPKAYIDKNGEPQARISGRAVEVYPVERRGDTEVSPQLNTGLAPRAWVPSDANLAATLGATPIDDSEAPF